MASQVRTNIAFAGLTAAGKTTHARRLAQELGYEYISATQILLEILEIDHPPEGVWFAKAKEISQARIGDAADWELERRLMSIARSRDGIVFDTWALAWIADSPIVRIWIESDEESRDRKCFVSQGERPSLTIEQCRELVYNKDEETRQNFARRHNFDLRVDRAHYDLILCNSHLIPNADRDSARAGIEAFAPAVFAACTEFMSVGSLRDETMTNYSREILYVGALNQKEVH